MTSLTDRYGVPTRRRRVGVLVSVGVVVAAFLGWLAWAAWFHATPEVESEFLGFTIVDEHAAAAVVDVRVATGTDASCVVQALAEDHNNVGELAFVPGDGRNEVTIRTERLATTVTLVGCTTADQARPR